MAVFTINGRETDSMKEAQDILSEEWSKWKAPAVEAQHAEALQKPSDLDLQRAARGVSAPEISASGAAKTLAARAEAAAKAAAEAEVVNN